MQENRAPVSGVGKHVRTLPRTSERAMSAKAFCVHEHAICVVTRTTDRRFAECEFVKIDVDENEETTSYCNVTQMPTFQFYRCLFSLAGVHGAESPFVARSCRRSDTGW